MSALRLLALAGVVFVLSLALAFCAGRVTAHDPYTGIKNRLGHICCNERDCKPVADADVGKSGEYYTWGRWRIHERDTIPSPDERYHVCTTTVMGVMQGIRCFLRPVTGV